MSEAADWWYESNEQRLGPISLAELQTLVAAGTVGAQTRVWQKGMNDWVAAGGVAVLFKQRADPGLQMLLPVGRSGFAIAAGYCGLLSIIPFVSLLAFLFATLAVFDLKRHPEKTGWGRILTGYIMGAVCAAFWGFAIFAR